MKCLVLAAEVSSHLDFTDRAYVLQAGRQTFCVAYRQVNPKTSIETNLNMTAFIHSS